MIPNDAGVNFDFVAPIYRWMELLVFGRLLEKRRFAFSNDVLDAKNILILGDGDGRFAAMFLKTCRSQSAWPKEVHVIDSSTRMMRLAQRRIQKLNTGINVQFQVADIQTALFYGPYDLVITHFFLDCFSTGALQEWTRRLVSHTAGHARWLVSEFARPGKEPWRMLASLLVRLMYFFFQRSAGLQTARLPDYQQVLKDQGFIAVKSQGVLQGFLVSELWSRETQHESPSEYCYRIRSAPDAEDRAKTNVSLSLPQTCKFESSGSPVH